MKNFNVKHNFNNIKIALFYILFNLKKDTGHNALSQRFSHTLVSGTLYTLKY